MSGAATLTAVSPRKRDGGQCLSGNPRRRGQQLASRNPVKTGRPDASSWARELSVEDRRSFGDLARRLAGRAPVMRWWAQSHDRVIKSFLDEPMPERPVDIETRACLAAAAKSLADAGLSAAAVPAPDEEDGWVPGEALVARDAYGSRFLLAVPFSCGEAPGEGDHWYAWDVDSCWLVTVVGAGAFGSAEDALTEWRDAASWSLAPCLAMGERRPRSSQPRSTPLPSWTGTRAGTPMSRILASSGSRPPRRQGSCWRRGGPREHPAEETVYSCSPHRVEMLGRLVRDDYLPKEGNAVVALLPDWVQWCADRTGLPAALAAPALEARKMGYVYGGIAHLTAKGAAGRTGHLTEPGRVRAAPAAAGGGGPHHRRRGRRCLADLRGHLRRGRRQRVTRTGARHRSGDGGRRD